jgi:hypothetical protein
MFQVAISREFSSPKDKSSKSWAGKAATKKYTAKIMFLNIFGLIISCEFCITNNIGKDYGGEFAGLFSHYAVNLPIILKPSNPTSVGFDGL